MLRRKNFCNHVFLMLLCVVMLIPSVSSSAEEKKYYQSGIYTYTIQNEQEKQISICGIASSDAKIVIPSELDGYQVVALGYESYAYEDYEGGKEIDGDIADGIAKGIKENMEELVIPSSVKCVWPFAFSNCAKLRKVSLPEGVRLCYASFGQCNNWKDIMLPRNTVCEDRALPSDGVIRKLEIHNSITGEDVLHGEIAELILSENGETTYNLASSWVSVTVKELLAPSNIEKLMFNQPDGDSRVKKLYINGKHTTVEANLSSGAASQGKVSFDEVFTVNKAKAVSFAKKNKIKYHVKKTEKMKKVSAKKKQKQYQYKWKKARTTVTSFTYNKSKKKWKSSKKNVPTVYAVYGKKTSKGTYELIAATTKCKIKTSYKYVKVKPVQTW